jgi:hypothetical protein
LKNIGRRRRADCLARVGCTWGCRSSVSSRHLRVARPVGRQGKVVARVAVKG